MRIERHFTTAGHDPYEGVEFTARESKIVNPDGSAVFAATGLLMPSAWSQVAVDIMAQKYFRKRGVPTSLKHVWEADVPPWLWTSTPDDGATDEGGETDARQVFNRLAGTWTYWGWKHNYFDTEQDAAAFYDELCHMMATQRAAPNSPQWFNTGLHWAYGITGPAQGHWYVDPSSDVLTRSTSAYERPQPHACFIQSVSDDLVSEGGIMDLWTREARIFKYGSGTGSNFSKLRGENEPLSGGGKSSGLMSFLKIGDRAAGAIKSGGTTRRAAKMVIVNADHPDIEQFIEWKVLEEQKVASLVAGSKVTRRGLRDILDAARDGIDPVANRSLRRAVSRARRDGVAEAYIQRVLQRATAGDFDFDFREFDTDWQGEAYLTVSGQNSNNSVRVTADFLRAVEDDGDWDLIRRTDGTVERTVKASALWDRIANAAWQSADPGLQYDTTINEWHTSPAGGRIEGSNPCSEYMFLDDTACNLASLNVLAFYDQERAQFDIPAYEHASRLWTMVLEISVLMAQYPSREIARLSWDYRTLGIGYANLGALLMVQGIPYDSPEALAQTGALTAILTGVSYATSAEMAASLGAFPRYAENRAAMLRVIRNHRRAAYDAPREQYEGLTVLPKAIDQSRCPQDLLRAAQNAWDRALNLGETHGYRNAQVSLIAPTGTIGLLMDCDTTGVEPDFALVKFKKLAGGGYFRIANESMPGALARLGYSPEQAQAIIAYCAGTGSLDGAPHINRESLAARGFGDELLARIDAALPSAFDITFAFNKWSLGEDFCRDVLGFTAEQLANPGFGVLEGLGFTRAQIEEANDAIVGRMTIEGAPYLKPEHYAVFDCANRCGKYGTRYIAPMAHVRILAAAQPFISGAISKTINMPFDATVQDVADVYMEAAKQMVKAVALYRDGSKLSQPLSAVAFDDLDEDDEYEELAPIAAPVAVEHPAVRAAQELLRGQREKLPTRRRGYAQKAKVGGHSIYLHTGEFDPKPGQPARLGEIFVSMSKEGAAFGSLMNCFAIAVSIGLQHGVPLGAYVDSFIFQKFEPNGMVIGHDRISMATSIIDYLFRELAVTYLGRDELAHFGPPADHEPVADNAHEALEAPTQMTMADVIAFDAGDADTEVVAAVASTATAAPAAPVMSTATTTVTATKLEVRVESKQSKVAEARLKGYEGDPCDECGQLMMVRNGTCLKCLNCGATSGCS
jgi:ribonucleoside-diphosphate reductase alpha chain